MKGEYLVPETISKYMLTTFIFLVVSNILLFVFLMLKELFVLYRRDKTLKDKRLDEQQQFIIDTFNKSLESKKILNIMGRYNRVVLTASIFFVTYKIYDLTKAIIASIIFYILMLVSYRISDWTDYLNQKFIERKKK